MKPVEIKSPVRGMWSFMNPPGHHPDAKDFVAVNERGAPYAPFCLLAHALHRLDVTETFAWEEGVSSPLEGTVRKIENDRNDRISLNLFRDLFGGLVIAPRKRNSDIGFFLGNDVVIESNHGVFALVAHLKKGSVVVEIGQSLHVGDAVAQVGNSGNTIQPHLHFQLMRENSPSKANPIPFLLESYQKLEDGSWNLKRSGLPRNYQIFRV